MATQDDDTGDLTDPDGEPSAAELAHARRFAELVDKTLSGRTPPAMSADDRALLEVATVIRATHGHVELAPSRQRTLVEDALRQAIGAAPAAAASATPISRARRRWVPWAVASTSTMVAAAALLLWLRAPTGSRLRVPAELTSRPADSLVGPIARDHAGDASTRIDAIFADRLDGYRALRWARGGKP